MATYGELIAHRLRDVDAIRRAVGADTLGYLTLEGAYRAVGLDPAGLCTACFSGQYPVSVQLEFEAVDPKLRLAR
jgi:amidophosphoribosyltransferase